mgnify:CR=1 FL=1
MRPYSLSLNDPMFPRPVSVILGRETYEPTTIWVQIVDGRMTTHHGTSDPRPPLGECWWEACQ